MTQQYLIGRCSAGAFSTATTLADEHLWRLAPSYDLFEMTFRDDNEALRAKLAAKEDELARLKAELDAKTRPKPAPVHGGDESPQRLLQLVSASHVFQRLTLGFSLFAILFVASFGMALAPTCTPVATVTAPVSCPRGAVRSFTKVFHRSTGNGNQSDEWEFKCVMADGTEHEASAWAAWLSLFVVFAVPTAIIAAIARAILLRRLRR